MLEMAKFRFHLAWVADSSGSVGKAFDNACFDPRMAVGSEVQVAVGVRRFFVHRCGEAIVSPLDEYVQEWEFAFFFRFHGELDAWCEGVEVGEKVVERIAAMWPGVIHVA